MSGLPQTSSAAVPDKVDPARRVNECEPAGSPSLITEQEVIFGSAAALAVPASKRRHWLAGLLSSFVLTSRGESRPRRRHYPPRHTYLESSRMAREMERL
jgi:hypothetical protein